MRDTVLSVTFNAKKETEGTETFVPKLDNPQRI